MKAAIRLTKRKIDAALPRVRDGLNKYSWLQSNLRRTNVATDQNYQTRFNSFYKVRRGLAWRESFYELLESCKKRPKPFDQALQVLHDETGRWEASFASKLLATVDTRQPVIDSVVLRNVGLRLPTSSDPLKRKAKLIRLHNALNKAMRGFLPSEEGKYLVRRFKAVYGNPRITTMKMTDLVLWQTRTKRK